MYTYTFQAGIPSLIMNAVYAPQQKEYWCWTASITNILKAYGITNISQNDFARDICGISLWGQARNCAANSYDISRSLNFTGKDQFGRHFEVQAPIGHYSPDINALYNELINNRPVLVAYQYPHMQMGHAVVITGCECGVRWGQTYITKLFVRDPSPNFVNQLLQGRQEITNVDDFLNAIYSHWFVKVYR